MGRGGILKPNRNAGRPKISTTKTTDTIQDTLAEFAHSLNHSDISASALHAAKGLVIDTLGALIAGFPYEPCRALRAFAAGFPAADAAILGTRTKTTLDMAAFVNATTARYIEANDVYARHKPGYMHGHPSDVITPLLSVAEHTHASGRELLTGLVLAYEIYLGLCDNARNGGFDPAGFGCIAVAAGAGRLLGLSREQLAHAIANAAVPNVMLKQVRTDHLTPWKAIAAGHAGKAGVFAALLARAGVAGPHLPFEGQSGWCEHVAGQRFTLTLARDTAARYKILGARIKPRPARALAIPAIMAAEKVRPAPAQIQDTKHVLVEVHRNAKRGTHEEHWSPDSRETADHSIPYGVAVTLLDGAVMHRSFDEARVHDPQVRTLMQKIELAEDAAFSAAFEGTPQYYRARVTLTTHAGERLCAESGGDEDDLATPKSDAQIEQKFRVMTEGALDEARRAKLLHCLWQLHELPDAASLPEAFVLT